MAKLGVGIIGVGEMGKRHAENLARLVPQARLVAIADANLETARSVARTLEVERYYGSADDMLAQADVQAVVIASPAKFHPEGIRLAAAAGKHILC
jgi:myo-inositol 2-dehydrogenase / D-chiro-inositol 1-dehydrogenase